MLLYDLKHAFAFGAVHKRVFYLNPLSANPTKWSNTLKQFVGNLLTSCLSVFDHFVNLAFQGLRLKTLLQSLLKPDTNFI